MSGHKAGASGSLVLDVLLLVPVAGFLFSPAALRTLSMRLGPLDLSSLSSLSLEPRFWSLESIYFPIAFANAFESFATIDLVVPRIRDISLYDHRLATRYEENK